MTTVYLVDDHALMRDGLRTLLVAEGHVVVGESAEPGHAAGEIVRLSPQLVLLDLHLGLRFGFELLVDLQRRKSEARTIVLTMSARPRHVVEALKMGAMGYVLKGSSASELLQAMASVMQGRRYLGAEVADLAARGLTEVDPGAALLSLSPRERQVIVLVARGRSSSEIGAALHLSPKTVDSYRSRLMSKIGAGDVPALVRFAIRTGLIDAEER